MMPELFEMTHLLLLQHVDGDNSERFVRGACDKRATMMSGAEHQIQWLVQYWVSQVSNAGVQVKAGWVDELMREISVKGYPVVFTQQLIPLILDHDLPK